MWKNFLFVGLILGAFIFYFSANYPNETQAYATVFGLVSILFAYSRFRSESKEKEQSFVIEQLNFFRTEILRIEREITKQLRSKDSQHDFSGHRTAYLEDFTYEWAYLFQQSVLLNQEKVISENDIGLNLLEMFNALEQFSWSLILRKTTDHPALYVVHDAFVYLIETFTHELLFKHMDSPKLYSGIALIYGRWGRLISRETEEEKLKKIGNKARELLSNQ